jgi:Putative MetA-pathway of phenol degradation
MASSSRLTSARAAAALALALAALLWSGSAAAQACCAGSGAVTPARLGLHEDFLVGLQLKGASHVGSHDTDATFVPIPAGARELNLEQNLFAAVRVLERGQVGALIPFIETYRRTSNRSELGGGIGDVNLSARYDFLLARESQYVPGIGVLAGTTLPTGTAVEEASNTLATDATGIGAVQANGGLALEQSFGSWLVGLSGLASFRAPRTVANTRLALAPQFTGLASAGYAFGSGATAAAVVSYAVEGDAAANGVNVPNSARRVTSVSLAAAYPVTDQIRIVGSIFANPPLSSLGRNQPVTVGGTLAVIWALL